MTQALLIVDIQNDYFPGGKMELVGSDAAAVEASRLLRAFRERSAPIFHVQHVSTRPGATFFLPDSEGVKIHASVAPLASETVITKHFPNSFRETRLLEGRGARRARRIPRGAQWRLREGRRGTRVDRGAGDRLRAPPVSASREFPAPRAA